MDPTDASPPTDAPLDVILIIEDVPNVTRLIKVSLAQEPLRIRSAADGLEGLELARTLRPALILLDLSLPSMHGFDILRALRADGATASIPVIILTAQSDSQTEHEAKRLGADGFLAKPFLPNELRQAIDCCLDAVRTKTA